MKHVSLFALKWGMEPTATGNQELSAYVATWKSANRNISADAYLKLMREHYKALEVAKQDYAATFINKVEIPLKDLPSW